jgi:D-alanyl-D-alanine carboxypeptidase/D-alanyl-D-alanine-endopeptidase (penicillin-binding protein 4)
MVIYALAEKYFGKPGTAVNGLLMVDSLIKLTGLNPSDYHLADGSGVSHYNLVSAELLSSVLKYLYYQQPDAFEKLYNSLASAGEDGTLMNRMRETSSQGRVNAKTGTLTGVSCLTGYIDSISGNKFAFSIMIQSFAGDAGYARYVQDELCRIITEYQ